jgi:hypothetical protein
MVVTEDPGVMRIIRPRTGPGKIWIDLDIAESGPSVPYIRIRDRRIITRFDHDFTGFIPPDDRIGDHCIAVDESKGRSCVACVVAMNAQVFKHWAAVLTVENGAIGIIAAITDNETVPDSGTTAQTGNGAGHVAVPPCQDKTSELT